MRYSKKSMITIQQTEKLLRGRYAFKLWAFSMLITQLKHEYHASPTQTILEQCYNKVNTFLNKFKAVMAQDYDVIKNILQEENENVHEF